MRKSLIIIALLAVCLAAYFLIYKNATQHSLVAEKLTVATVDSPSFALMYIAEKEGYFKDEGVDVTYRKFPKGLDALTDALSGNSDIGLSFETPAVRKIYEGNALRIIGTMHTSTKDTAIVARKDKGIFVASDLKGKKIGITKTSSYEFFLYSYLLSQGIKLSDVTFVDDNFKNMIKLLTQGKVDAVAIGNPYLYDIRKSFLGSSLSVFQSEVYTESSIIAGKEDILKAKKEPVERFLRALARAEKFYNANNQAALNDVVAELPDFSEKNIRDTWSSYVATITLNNVLLTLLEREGQWFKDNGVYKTDLPDFRAAIVTEYLKSVDQDAVTLY